MKKRISITPRLMKAVDPTGMHAWLAEFPTQVEEAVHIGIRTPLIMQVRGITSIVLTGMGGSAIGGDLLRSCLIDELKVPFVVNRSYMLPAFVGPNTLVIVSSYSGNTEETLAAYKEARRRRAKVLCITTGGETERLAARHGNPCIKVPPGLQPRAALGYSFFPLVIALSRLGFVKSKLKDCRETIRLLKSRSKRYADPKNPRNLPLAMARRLAGRLPIFYSSSDHLDAVNVRWRGQMSENAKRLAFGHVLPEMNHNEIVGWDGDRALTRKMAVVFLRDRGTHPRVVLREDITRDIVKRFAADLLEVRSEGSSLLTRIFSLVYVGDWLSYYLAILNGVDPTPVKPIEHLKKKLSKT